MQSDELSGLAAPVRGAAALLSTPTTWWPFPTGANAVIDPLVDFIFVPADRATLGELDPLWKQPDFL